MTEPKIAIVTGGASGIGAQICAELDSAGWSVASFDLKHASGVHLSLRVDVTDFDAVADAVGTVSEELGAVRGAVAGAGYYEELDLDDISPAAWRSMLRVHVGGVFNLLKAVVPLMRKNGSGRFVTIASERAIGGGKRDAHYASAKAAALALTRSAAAELGDANIQINAVAPGPTDTPLLPPDSWERGAAFLSTLAVPRIANTDEIALAVRSLLEDPLFLNGEVISINSGTVI